MVAYLKECVVLLCILASCSFCAGQNQPCNFVYGGSISTGASPYVIASADIDGDGDMDLAVSQPDGATVSLYLNNGNAEFQLLEAILIGTDVTQLEFADMNGDQLEDLVVVSWAPHVVMTFINDSQGIFQDPVLSAYSGACPDSMDFGDVDGDGNYDLLIGGFQGPDPWESFSTSLLGDGTGAFQQRYYEHIWGIRVADSGLGDFDGDGDLDAVLTGYFFDPLLLRDNDGTGFFEPGAMIEAPGSGSTVVVADFNADSNVDFAVGSHSQSGPDLSVYLNQGSSFAPPIQYNVTGNPFFMETADMDSDSDLDLVAANIHDSTVTIMTNDGNGEFGQPSVVPVGMSPRSLTLADFNGDKYVDIATANYESNDITILLNQPVLRGDVNLDGEINLQDVSPFVDLLVAGEYQAQADLNCDSELNLLDVSPFVEALTGN